MKRPYTVESWTRFKTHMQNLIKRVAIVETRAKNNEDDIDELQPAVEDLQEFAENTNDMTTGINLIRGSRDFKVGVIPYGTADGLKLDGTSSYPSSNFEVYKDELGYSVYRYLGNASTATYKFLNVILPSQVNGYGLTISFEYMIESETASNGMLFQLLKMSLKDPGQTLKVFYYSDTEFERPFVKDQWYKIVLYYDEPLNLTKDEYLRIGLTCGPNADLTRVVNYRKVKVEIGHVNNPIYSVSPLDMALEPFNDITTGINLLKGTRDFTQGTVPWATSSYWKTDGFGGTDIDNYYTKSIDSDGFTVIHTENPAGSTTIKAPYANMVTGFNLGDVVTFSFDFKIDDVDSYDPNQSIARYDVFPANSAATTYGANFSLTQGCSGEIESGVWYRWSFPITLGGISSELDGVLFSSRITRQAGISFRKLKLERGRIEHTEWSANPFDLETDAYPLLKKAIRIPDNSDANDYLLTPATYYVPGIANAGTIKNLPVNNGLRMYSFESLTAGSVYVVNLAFANVSNIRSFLRRSDGSWKEYDFKEDIKPYIPGLYTGVNIATKFQSEIGSNHIAYWLSSRVSQGNFEGLNIGDYVDIACTGVTRRFVIAAIDPYYNSGSPTRMSHHILMASTGAWTISASRDGSYAVGTSSNRIYWNTERTNNGTASETNPYLASNLHKWETEVCIKQFPQEWQDVMIDRYDHAETRYSASSTLTSPNGSKWVNLGKIWSFSEMELYGVSVHGSASYNKGLNCQIPFFSMTSSIQKCIGQNGVWLRTVADNSSTNVSTIDYVGHSSSSYANNTNFNPFVGFLVG